MELITEHLVLSIALFNSVLTYLWLRVCKKRITVGRFGAACITAVIQVCGVALLKLFPLIESGFNPQEAANLRIYGVTFFMPLVFYAIAKVANQNVRDVLDVGAVTVFICLFTGRISCLYSGCCGGFEIVQGSGIEWPIREVEMLYYVVMAFLIGKRVIKNETNGEVYPIYMVSYGCLRFCIEWLRIEYVPVGIFHLAHIWSLLSIAIGLSVLFEMKAHKEKKGKVRR